MLFNYMYFVDVCYCSKTIYEAANLISYKAGETREAAWQTAKFHMQSFLGDFATFLLGHLHLVKGRKREL